MLRTNVALLVLSVLGLAFPSVLWARSSGNKEEGKQKSTEYEQMQEKVVADVKKAWEASKLADSDPDGLVDGNRDLIAAIRKCGYIRSVKAVPDLVRALNVVGSQETLTPGGTEWDSPALWDLYPARAALVKIGTPALPELVGQFTGSKQPKVNSIREYALLQIVVAIAGPEGSIRLFEEAINEAKKDVDKKSLKNALEKFKNMRSVPMLVENPSFQLFTGNVFETIGRPEDEDDIVVPMARKDSRPEPEFEAESAESEEVFVAPFSWYLIIIGAAVVAGAIAAFAIICSRK